MYIRAKETKNKATGAVYIKHQLIESVRTPSGPRQRIVMDLGQLDLSKSEMKKLAHAISLRLAGRESVFEEDDKLRSLCDEALSNYDFVKSSTSEKEKISHDAEVVPIDVNSISPKEVRSLGPELVVSAFYDKLGVADALRSAGLSDKACALAKAVVLTRATYPASDLATHKYLCERSALFELLDVDLSGVGKDLIYEICDVIYQSKAQIESHLTSTQVELFPREHNLFLFDLTNTYFEGQTHNNEIAAYGHSKEKRYDCTLVSLALLVDHRGLPIYSEIYSGSQSEPRTLKDVLDKVKEMSEGKVTDEGEETESQSIPNLFPAVEITIVADKGIATKENLSLISSYGFRYLVITRGDKARNYVSEFREAKDTFECISDDSDDYKVYVKEIVDDDHKTVDTEDPAAPTTKVVKVACLSERRQLKEEAIHRGRVERFTTAFEKLQSTVQRGNLKKIGSVNRRVGALFKEHSSLAKEYAIEVITAKDNASIALDLSLTHNEEVSEKVLAVFGAYVIETDAGGLTPRDIWNSYMTLTKVEEAFRALKSDLGIRPIYHQLASRTKAHLFISVLAYHIVSAVTLTLRDQGDSRSYKTVRETLSTHSRMTISFTDEDKTTHNLRVSSTPTPEQREIYRLLGVSDPLKRYHSTLAAM